MISKTPIAARHRLLPAWGLALALLLPLGSVAIASGDGGGAGSIVGPYAVQVTLRDCTTGAPAGPPFDSLVTFHAGGTISESAGGRAFAPGQRSAGHGSWVRVGHRTYRQEMIALLTFDNPANLPGTPTFDPTRPITPGFSAGWATVSHVITFTDASHATSSGTNAFYTLAGVKYREGCSTAIATRVGG
jgi:hypothetical protein